MPAVRPWVLPPLAEGAGEVDAEGDSEGAGDGDAAAGETPGEAGESPQVPPHDRSWGPRPTQQAPLPGVLDALRAGRLDPARRGALALALVAVVACVVAGVLLLRSRPHELPVPQVERPGTAIPGTALPATAMPGSALPGSPAPAAGSPSSEGAPVVVAVAGRVRRPGVVRLASGSRVEDAVRAAGGPLPGASAGLLNLARRLVDGEQVLVGVEHPPGTAPATSGDAAAVPGTSGGGAVDLNTATAAELDALPGIGPVLAERIVAWRAQNGPFRSVDQLREVAGIGEAKFATLRPEVRV